MPTISERSFRLAVLGYVPDDDPEIVADMQNEIDRLRKALSIIADMTPDDDAPPVARDALAGHAV